MITAIEREALETDLLIRYEYRSNLLTMKQIFGQLDMPRGRNCCSQNNLNDMHRADICINLTSKKLGVLLKEVAKVKIPNAH